jgi:putative addiction module component (TIGR02574 family)
MISAEFSHLLALDPATKLELIGALWQSLDEDEQQVPVADALVAELERRKSEADSNPASLVPWETIKLELGLGDGR